jgi:CBS domain-containing protein
MSPRAAWRLESLGFTDVYDYIPGKTDWAAAGLPVEGTAGPSVGDVARTDVPTCKLADDLTDVRRRARADEWDTCIVVNDENIVLGRLGRRSLADDGGNVEEAMTSGPSTVRPSLSIATMAERMESRRLTNALVTTSDGRLVGIAFRADVERALTQSVRD